MWSAIKGGLVVPVQPWFLFIYSFICPSIHPSIHPPQILSTHRCLALCQALGMNMTDMVSTWAEVFSFKIIVLWLKLGTLNTKDKGGQLEHSGNSRTL